MGFSDLRAPADLMVLNDNFADKSYIEGYVPFQADVVVFEVLSSPLPLDLFHSLRWYNHNRSYEKEKSSLPGVKKPLGKYYIVFIAKPIFLRNNTCTVLKHLQHLYLK
ncbi:EF1B factor, partial [Polypterus senegalus]